MTLKPLVLHGKGPTPNPIKVAILLEELGLPFTTNKVNLTNGEHKQEPFINLNPNGRLPALEDPNTGIVLFESGAIIEYLIETYDKEEKFQINTTAQTKWIQRSWLYFQMSGQGPYFGQITYFTFYHWEKNIDPSIIERFEKEAKRVTTVIDTHLKKHGTPYLVGDKVTYADLAWVPWFHFFGSIVLKYWNYEEELPTFAAWKKSLSDRPAVKKIYSMPEFQADH